MSLFLQVYSGCGVATLIGFLALCHITAMRARQSSPSAAIEEQTSAR
jgi:hypothetical protein